MKMERQSSPLSSFLSNKNGITKQNGKQKKSLGVGMTTVFIIGTMCGVGLVAVPQTFIDSGYFGFGILTFCGIVSAYSGILLGRCWVILRNRYPEYKVGRITSPYPTIAFRVGGNFAKYVTKFSIYSSSFGSATVYMLLIAENVSNLIRDLGKQEFSLCYVVLFLFGLLSPLTWLGSPKDFWQVGVLAAATSILSAILISIGLFSIKSESHYSEPAFRGITNAFAVIIVSFGGTSCFPTIQVDMKNPNKFQYSVSLGVGVVWAVYFVVGTIGLFFVGDDMQPNVLMVLPAGAVSYTVNVLLTSHLLMSYVIMSNPINQEIEGLLNIPDEISLRRVISRTSLAAIVAFVALSIPHFNVILSLIGGSTGALISFVLPPLYYILLSRQKKPDDAFGPLPFNESDQFSIQSSDELSPLTEYAEIRRKDISHKLHWEQIQIPCCTKLLLITIILIGLLGGSLSTYFSIFALIHGDSEFTVPCYVNASVRL